MKLLFAVVAFLLLLALAAEGSSSSSAQERLPLYFRASEPLNSGWTRTARANPNHPVTFMIALKQQNVWRLQQLLLADSDPNNPLFGRHMTREQIMELVAPPKEVQDRVLQWILETARSHGRAHLQKLVNLGDAIQVKSTASFAERLFQTELYSFFNAKKKGTVVKHLGTLSVPISVAGDIDIITGLTEFPPTDLPFITSDKNKRQREPSQANNLCNVPYTLKKLYGIPLNLSVTNPGANQSIYAEQSAGYPEGFGLPGLDYYEAANDLTPNNITCILGTGLQYYQPDNDTDIEAHLDTDMMTGMAMGAKTCFYIMEYGQGWMFEFANYVFQTPGAPWVISMSYGWVEVEQCINDTTYQFLGNCSYFHIPNSADYINRTNTEFMKLGLMGYSLLAASGDDGTSGTHGSWDDCQELGPIFPAASPWVVAVGATSIEPSNQTNPIGKDAPPVCTQPQYYCTCSTSTNEQIALQTDSAFFDTGGGFSQFSPMQPYQKAAVSAYLKSGVTLPLKSLYNPNNRAFPDIGAVGESFCCLDTDGSCFLVGGTSASTPMIASIVTLLNQDRLNAGKTTLGFFTPLIYDMYAKNATYYFNTNFTDGNNSGECPATHGFNANPKGGWNPLVGVGSPKFAAIREYVASLP